MIDTALLLASAIQVARASQHLYVPAGTGVRVHDIDAHMRKSLRVTARPLDLMAAGDILRQNGVAGGVFDATFPRAHTSPRLSYAVDVHRDSLTVWRGGTIQGRKQLVMADLKMPGRWGTKLAFLGAALAVTDLSMRAFSSDHRGLERIFT